MLIDTLLTTLDQRRNDRRLEPYSGEPQVRAFTEEATQTLQLG